MKIGPFLIGFAIAAGLFSFVSGSVRFAAAAPDNKLGMAVMAAHVKSDGSLLEGSGATAAAKLGTGQYSVDFDRSVQGCFFSGTATILAGTTQNVTVQPSSNASFTNRVLVLLDDSPAPAADGEFYLLVYCSK